MLCFPCLLLGLAARSTLWGFTPFPYDSTLEAVRNTRAAILPNSTLYALHFDDGVPWEALIRHQPFPRELQTKWDDAAKGIPKDHVVYLALAPLATDRKNLARCIGGTMPTELTGQPLDSPVVEAAYLEYVRRGVREFKPSLLNVGIESGELMSRDFSKWPEFERLFSFVRKAIKSEFPAVQVGISFGLGELRIPREANAARQVMNESDYVGISFYPYASGFDQKFGAPPYLGDSPWREPLNWLKSHTNKPIAICETGFTTREIDIPQFGLRLHGTASQQAQYVKELFEVANRDHYLFAVWFLAIDYDRLYSKMPAGSEVNLLWRNIGLIDGNLTPKPAWSVWKTGVAASKRGF